MSDFKPTRFRKLIALLVAVLITPSAAMAFEDEPDEVLSVTVELPADGGDDGSEGCSGYSSMTLSQNNLASTLDEISPAVSEPTLEQRLALYGFTLNTNDDDGEDLFTLEEEGALDGSDRLSISADVAWYQQDAISMLDTNEDGFVDNSDLTLLSLDRRVFVTDEFSVEFDASTCVNSSYIGSVEAERSEVQMRNVDLDGSGWDDVEIFFDQIDALEDLSPLVGESYLSTTLRIGPLNVPRRLLQRPWDGDQPILFGSDGTRAFRAVTRLFGEGESGQFRTQYYFWLDISDANGNFNGGPFGPP